MPQVLHRLPGRTKRLTGSWSGRGGGAQPGVRPASPAGHRSGESPAQPSSAPATRGLAATKPRHEHAGHPCSHGTSPEMAARWRSGTPARPARCAELCRMHPSLSPRSPAPEPEAMARARGARSWRQPPVPLARTSGAGASPARRRGAGTSMSDGDGVDGLALIRQVVRRTPTVQATSAGGGTQGVRARLHRGPAVSPGRGPHLRPVVRAEGLRYRRPADA